MSNIDVKKLLEFYLSEDLGYGDITTDLMISGSKIKTKKCKFKIISKHRSDVVVCGLKFIQILFKIFDEEIEIYKSLNDGDLCKEGSVIIEASACIDNILKIERVMLNILQHLSAISTKTRSISSLLKGSKIQILDTRKTVPGFRYFQKYAVKIGGGVNHRFNLNDAVLIKDNHISFFNGDVKLALEAVFQALPSSTTKVEIECDSIEQVSSIVSNSPNLPDIIMLDNFDLNNLPKAISLIKSAKKDIKIEISGGINEQNIQKYKKLDIDYISLGSLTHSVAAIDLSLEVESEVCK